MNMSHFDASGRAVMVDVSQKQTSVRTAVAQATVKVKPATLAQIKKGTAAKGDVLNVARLAGIMAAKRTPDLIPLAHPLAVHAASVEFDLDQESSCVVIKAEVRAVERTGVEMEAMTAASIAALTIYDMCKGVDRSISIEQVFLTYKSGGKSGTYERQPDDQ